METENTHQALGIKNYGFVAPKTIEHKEYVLGGVYSLPQVNIQPNRQWDDFLPEYEPQFGENWDTFGCTIWGTENALEILEYRLRGIKKNYSERSVYIGTNTRPPGNDPHVIAEWIRDNGLVDDSDLPMAKSFEEFITPDPLPREIIKKGKSWASQNSFGHQWVFRGSESPEEKTNRMMDELQRSPLGISVSAWEEQDGIYIDGGNPNNHWCVCYGHTEKGWKIFDSYDHSRKIYSYDSEISFCKRYTISTKPLRPQCIFSKLFDLF